MSHVQDDYAQHNNHHECEKNERPGLKEGGKEGREGQRSGDGCQDKDGKDTGSTNINVHFASIHVVSALTPATGT